jgi:hypothetical protein
VQLARRAMADTSTPAAVRLRGRGAGAWEVMGKEGGRFSARPGLTEGC